MAQPDGRRASRALIHRDIDPFAGAREELPDPTVSFVEFWSTSTVTCVPELLKRGTEQVVS